MAAYRNSTGPSSLVGFSLLGSLSMCGREAGHQQVHPNMYATSPASLAGVRHIYHVSMYIYNKYVIISSLYIIYPCTYHICHILYILYISYICHISSIHIIYPILYILYISYMCHISSIHIIYPCVYIYHIYVIYLHILYIHIYAKYSSQKNTLVLNATHDHSCFGDLDGNPKFMAWKRDHFHKKGLRQYHQVHCRRHY